MNAKPLPPIVQRVSLNATIPLRAPVWNDALDVEQCEFHTSGVVGDRPASVLIFGRYVVGAA
jgi:hypothetical protein